MVTKCSVRVYIEKAVKKKKNVFCVLMSLDVQKIVKLNMRMLNKCRTKIKLFLMAPDL